MTCNKSRVGQSGTTIAVRYKEHTRHLILTPPHQYMLSIFSISDMNTAHWTLAEALREEKSHELLRVFLHSTVTAHEPIDR
jgi:hypothetical protein